MRIDPRLQARKFEKEVTQLRANAGQLAAWGCWIVRAENPELDIAFVPRNTVGMRVIFPEATPTGVQLREIRAEHGNLAARAFGVRFLLDDYDQRPPSLEFRDPWTWKGLAFDDLPRVLLADNGPPMNVILDQHPDTKKPFLCVRGIREYHEHPQHNGDDWALYRGSMTMFTLVQRIWRICIAEMRPTFIVNLSLPGEIQTMTNWDRKQP